MSRLRLSHLSPARQDFVRRCQRIAFGKIVNLEIRDAEPVFTRQTDVLLDLKLGDEDQPRPEQNLPDYGLAAEIVRLLSMFDSIHDGVVEHIEIRTGLPRRIVVRASELEH